MSASKVGQYLNLRGVFRLVMNPRLARPTLLARSVCEIDFAQMKQRFEAEFVVFDKDNTLTLPYVDDVASDQHRKALDVCITVFSREKVLLFSNSAGSSDDVDFREALNLEKKQGIRVLRHKERKPGGGKSLLEVTKGRPTLVIGDRMFTDVVFANLNGCTSILVDPIDERKDNLMVSLVRKIEKICLKFM